LETINLTFYTLYRGLSRVKLSAVTSAVVAAISVVILLGVTPVSYAENRPLVSEGALSGRVTTTDKRPIAGALVTLFSEDKHISETVYTDVSGQYRMNTTKAGGFILRVRAPSFSDQLQNIHLKKGESLVIDVITEKLQEPERISNNLTASAHAATLQFSNQQDNNAFRSQCHFCHQIGNELTRRKRSEEEWGDVIERMESYGVLITNDSKDEFVHQLKTTFNGEPLETVQSWDYSPELSTAVFKEWRIGDAMSYVHDIEVGRDGKLYGVDMGNDKIHVVDPVTNQSQIIDFPKSELPDGGMFSGAYAPLGAFNSRHGPHSIQIGPHGKIWTTNSLASEIMSYEPETKKFTLYPIGGDTVYPHTLRFDDNGILWFTLALSNQIGRFDPKTEEFIILDTPSNGFWRWMADAMIPSVLEVASWFPKKDLHVTLSHHKVSGEGFQVLNLPYGIDINPIDGSVWYSKLYAGIIGRVDPTTMDIEEFKTPLSGPRRLRFAKDGTLWIPSFEESAIMKFDTTTKQFDVINMPTLAPGEYEIPYALNIHPDTGDVWVTSNLSDRLFRYLPKEKRFISYPSPTKVTYLRDIVFHPDGGVCSSNANLPAYAIEGGLQTMLCIYPDANKAYAKKNIEAANHE